MEKELMVLDGNSIVNRAFYGVKPLSTREGIPTGAVYGFLSILRPLLDNYKPDALCVAFDVHAPTFRHEMFEAYKGTRKGMPEELQTQMPILKEMLDALNIPRFELAGYEADDLLGTIAEKCAQSGWHCAVVTGDRDSFQLVSDTVRVLHVGNKETKPYNRERIIEEYSLTPEQLIDLKALMGDSSDNIPGVPGVGEKTASDLMKKYSSLDKVYENISEVTGKLKEKLENGKELAYISKKLAIIDKNVPIEFNPEDCIRKVANEPVARTLFYKLEFAKLLDKWLTVSKPDAGDNLSMFEAEETALPDGVVRNIKEIWRTDFQNNRPLTPCTADISLSAWLLQRPETDWDKMQEEMKANNLLPLFNDIEMPLSEVLASMEYYGIKVDREQLRVYGEALDVELAAIEKAVYESAGEKFNIGSPKQLGEVLFERLQLPHGKKNKSGWSTDVDTLNGLKKLHPVVSEVLKYRGLSKLKSTYVDGLFKCMDDTDHIHSTFQMTTTITGRLSSTDPNLQNIPIRTELGGQLRRMFVPSKPDWVLVDADYSQIELRVLAFIADDAVMKAAFASGEDIHAVTASQVFNVPQNEVTATMRRNAKAVNFGIVYGISAFSLAEDLGVSTSEAKSYITAYLEKYSGVRAYMHDIVAQARQDGYVTTLFGRRRYLPELASSNFNLRSFGERAAMNTPIQGSAADIIKRAMINVYNRIKAEKLQARLILQVHDELIIECPDSEKETVAKLVSEEMENAYPLNPSLVSEAHIGANWLEAK